MDFSRVAQAQMQAVENAYYREEAKTILMVGGGVLLLGIIVLACRKKEQVPRSGQGLSTQEVGQSREIAWGRMRVNLEGFQCAEFEKVRVV